MEQRELVFLKLGGSLITDKRTEETARPEVIRRLAAAVGDALQQRPSLRLVLGHGSGSFGHFAARRHHLLDPDREPNWRGYAEVGAAAARLNRLVTDLFLEADVPVVSLQPSASAECEAGRLIHLATTPLRTLLTHGCVPLVFGDVAVDRVWGHTIISTETIFTYLADRLRPQRILLVGQVDGVYTADPLRVPQARPIPRITPHTWPRVRKVLGGSAGVDVTGGMASKVEAMLALIQALPFLTVHIFSGHDPQRLTHALLSGEVEGGTVIHR